MTCACAVLMLFSALLNSVLHNILHSCYMTLSNFQRFRRHRRRAQRHAAPLDSASLTQNCAVCCAVQCEFSLLQKSKKEKQGVRVRWCACGGARARASACVRWECVRALVSLHGVSSRKNSSFKDRGQCTRIVHTLAHSGVTWPGEVLHAVLAEVDSLSAIFLAPPLTHCAHTGLCCLPSLCAK